ncbi:PIG-L family deacetylase [Candidatus Bathyarchaeota archaeon]|nr:MAG: PIG-L family deacetylase [Candidatus Bathyarchaeota archaeon]
MSKSLTVGVIVAHPDDETIWAGGLVLMNPDWRWHFISLCRGSDPDRAPRFIQAVHKLGGEGWIGDLDDGSEQTPLDEVKVRQTILSLLPNRDYDLVITHSPQGEYTRHRRHEECSKAVTMLWRNGLISIKELWMFAYRDSGKGGKDDLPQAIKTAHKIVHLSDYIQLKKHRIITDDYGFAPESYEANIVLGEEAFWCFHSPPQVREWLQERGELI